jgi:putative FmdB family regulatory protein
VRYLYVFVSNRSETLYRVIESRMPTYEYRCAACGHDFEKFQKMSEPPVAECAQCGATAERRMSAGAGLLFKGSGFYITDYRNDSYKKAASSEGGGGAENRSGDAAGPAGKAEKAAPASPPKPSAKSE